MLEKTVILLLAYLIGSIPFGLVFSRLVSGQDIRTLGSGNIGATNVFRSVGKIWGVLTLLADLAKGAVPVVMVRIVLPGQEDFWWWVGLAAVLGHCFSLFLGCRGGKGVATALGGFLILSPKALLVGIIVFGVAAFLTRTASVGSLSAMAGILVAIPLCHGLFTTAFLVSGLIAATVVLRHQANISRLIRGEELKIRPS